MKKTMIWIGVIMQCIALLWIIYSINNMKGCYDPYSDRIQKNSDQIRDENLDLETEISVIRSKLKTAEEEIDKLKFILDIEDQ